jgi:hypothetical protein
VRTARSDRATGRALQVYSQIAHRDRLMRLALSSPRLSVMWRPLLQDERGLGTMLNAHHHSACSKRTRWVQDVK